jgi:hypothetical protein
VKTPKLDTFVRITNALGVSTDALLQDLGTEHSDPHNQKSVSSKLSFLYYAG